MEFNKAKAAITCVRKLTDSHPKGVRQNALYLLHVLKVMRLKSFAQPHRLQCKNSMYSI